MIENYCPISNLCSTSKIFEKLILMCLNQLENGQTTTWLQKTHNTATLGLLIQSLLANALDKNQYALMASINLSAAFDAAHIKLLIKRLDIIGI